MLLNTFLYMLVYENLRETRPEQNSSEDWLAGVRKAEWRGDCHNLLNNGGIVGAPRPSHCLQSSTHLPNSYPCSLQTHVHMINYRLLLENLYCPVLLLIQHCTTSSCGQYLSGKL